jgi:hypothetical protein
MADSDRPQMVIWHMCTACWIIKTTETRIEHDVHSNNGYVNAPKFYVCTLIAYLAVTLIILSSAS